MEPRHFSLLFWFFAILFSVLALFTTLHAWSIRPSDAICTNRLQAWSPIHRGMQQNWMMFPNLTLFSKSEFFGIQFQDIDAAWTKFLPKYPIAIPKSRLSDLKLSANAPYVHPPRIEESVLAIPEAFVQLECLNLLRQHLALYTEGVDYSHLAAFKGSRDIVMHRADLCIERLRIMLMCWSDLGTVLQPLEECKARTDCKEPRSMLDFGTRHKCRDFSGIREWTIENAVRAVRMDNAWWGGRVFE